MQAQTDVRMFTNLKTNISKDKVISTIYRKYENMNFTSWQWETLVFNGEKIVDQGISNDIAEALEKHKEFFVKHSKEESK
ncbi:amidohydrolase [Oceanobacillus picturae]|uniref:Amidohydrolase n=1 Tax=Oceanobacillus picturae TaxID=171693 RepID=A0A0U9H5J7_9BACI|nr:hypothetical protein [Oceanobacillus picturae]GAQ17989.1 amidohydrolase [Oceanobacillus picturae]